MPTNTTLLPTQSPSAAVFLGLEIFLIKKQTDKQNSSLCHTSKSFESGPILAKLLRGSGKAKVWDRVSALQLEGEVNPALGLGMAYVLMSVTYHTRILCQKFS